ncbi:MAG: DUF4185 domain-containing protein [Elusimicrobiota bacterium]
MKGFRIFPILFFLIPVGLMAEIPKAVKPLAPAAQVAASPALNILSVKEIGPLLAPRKSSYPVVGQAGNYSVALGDGRTLWLLNNIWTGELKGKGEVSIWGMIEGGMAILSATSPYAAAGALSYVADENKWPLPVCSADLAEYIPVRKFWPRAGVKTESGYYAYYSIMNNFGPGAYDYFRVGQGLAVAEKPDGPYRLLKNGESYFLWTDIEPSFGSALLLDQDGWLYIYGRYAAEPGKYSAALARVRPEKAGEPEAYSYYGAGISSGSWTEDVSEAAPVMENIPEEFSVSYNDHLKAYLALYQDAETGAVRLKTAQYPWGPWSGPKTALSCKKEEYCFGAKEQAAFSSEGGKKIFFTVEKKNMPYFYELAFSQNP